MLAHGQPVLSLTTTGRRSGEPRSTVVAYMPHDGDYVVFGMNLGSERDPAWCLNLDADPRARVEVGGRSFDVVAHRAAGDEADRLWDEHLERVPASAAFRHIAGREIPIFVLRPL